VVDAVLDGLDASIKHRDVRLDAVLVAELRELEPALAGILSRQMTSRTRFSKISAPPPGQESIPASFSRG